MKKTETCLIFIYFVLTVSSLALFGVTLNAVMQIKKMTSDGHGGDGNVTQSIATTGAQGNGQNTDNDVEMDNVKAEILFLNSTNQDFKNLFELQRRQIQNLNQTIKEMRIETQNLQTSLNRAKTLGAAQMNWIVKVAGWYKASNGLLYKYFETYKNFELARKECESYGARLISTGIRNKTIFSEIVTKFKWSERYVWVGLYSYQNTNGGRTGSWSDNKAYDPSRVMWADGQPRNTGYCASARSTKLYIAGCDWERAHTCEFEF